MSSGLPKSRPDQNYVSVSPLEGGRITLPEKFFVSPADPNAQKTVPSLAFLITHPNPSNDLPVLRKDRQNRRIDGPLRLLFDLGLRSAPERYMPNQQKHLESRKPYNLAPGIAKALESGDLTPDDIDVVMFSHVHYDHHGDPEDFPSTDFIIGHGAWKVLKEGLGGLASHQHFQPDLLPDDRTTELPDPTQAPWSSMGPFKATLDLLGDGSIYLVDAPGHLPGHMNLLALVGEDKWLYLAGDTAHDLRLLSGEKEIGTWVNDQGVTTCIHLDPEKAAQSIKTLREFQKAEGDRVEVVIAHDPDWAEKNQRFFYPNHL